MRTKQHVTEQQIKKTIADYLRLKGYVVVNHRSVGIKKPNGKYIPLPNGETGVSDLLACSPSGQFVAIEVKKPGGKPSPNQLEFVKRISNNGGVGFIAYSLDEVIQALAISRALNPPVGIR